MITIKIKGPNTLQDVVNYDEKQFAPSVEKIWVGRGEELYEKQSEKTPILNLADFSESISRVHACFILSPPFAHQNPPSFPTFLRKLGQNWASLPNNLLFQIWSFTKSPKAILLKDMHSKLGLFEKIQSSPISAGMEVVFGDSRPVVFQHEEKYENNAEMRTRIGKLKQDGYIELKREAQGQASSFWIISYKNQLFILRNQESKMHIGRSNGCDIVISDGSVSRKHATLVYNDGKWNLIDGDGVTPSRNGLWRRVKKIMISCEAQDKTIYSSVAKMGGVMLTIEAKLQYSFLNVEELCQETNEANENRFIEQLEKELQRDGKEKEGEGYD